MLPCINILQWIDVHEYKQGFSAVTKNYSTCILFLPSEVTTELVRHHSSYKIDVTVHYYYEVTPSNTDYPPHMLSHTRWIIKNGVTICIYSYIKNMITVHIS
jgi:hypothetical protein